MASTISETIAEINKNVYLGKTATTPRPYAEDPNVVYADEADLRRRQGQWDAAKAWTDEDAKLRADRTAKLDADREADATRRKQETRADLEAAVKARFMAQRGVDEADWARLKGELIDRELLSAPNPIEAERARLLATGQYPRF